MQRSAWPRESRLLNKSSQKFEAFCNASREPRQNRLCASMQHMHDMPQNRYFGGTTLSARNAKTKWRWTQSPANFSPAKFPANREKFVQTGKIILDSANFARRPENHPKNSRQRNNFRPPALRNGSTLQLVVRITLRRTPSPRSCLHPQKTREHLRPPSSRQQGLTHCSNHIERPYWQ
jgi:hypothetical protein